MQTSDRSPLLSPENSHEVDFIIDTSIPPTVNWNAYVEAGIISSDEQLSLVNLNLSEGINTIWDNIKDSQNEYVNVFIKVLSSVHHDETLLHVLYIINSIFKGSCNIQFL